MLLLMRTTQRQRIHVQNFCTWSYVIFFMFVVTACRQERTIIEFFPTEKELHGETVSALDSIHNAFSIYWHNEKMYLSTKGDYHLLIYNEKENKCTKALRRGHGNNEWMAPMITTQQVIINGRELSCVLERTSSILYGVNLEDADGSRIFLKDFRDLRISDISSIFMLPDSSYWGIKDDNNCRPFRYDDKSGKVIEEEVNIDESMFSADTHGLSQNLSTYCEQTGKMAIGYYAFPLLVIKDKNQASEDLLIQIGAFFPTYKKENVAEAHFYILDVMSTSRYIYLLYDNPDIPDKTSILVFDWNGAPIAKYTTKRMSCFTVDEKSSRIIALNEDDSEGVCSIYKY